MLKITSFGDKMSRGLTRGLSSKSESRNMAIERRAHSISFVKPESSNKDS